MSTQCPMMVAFTQEGTPALLYCSKWDCPHCRIHNAGEWARVARYAVHYGQEGRKLIVFWTLTLGSNYKTTRDGYLALPRLWDNFRKTIQRIQGHFDYMAVVEEQPKKRKMPHFHVLAFASIPAGYSKRKDPHKWIKDFGVAMGFGHQCTEKVVDSEGAAMYIAKYLSKDGQGMPKGFRRVRCSRSWPKPVKQKKKPYLVRRIGEPIQDFLLRVEEKSGRDIDDLLQDYRSASTQMAIIRLEIEIDSKSNVT